MLRFNPQPEALGDTLRELANLAVAALVLAQFVGQQSRSSWAMVADLVAWLGLVTVSLLITGGEPW